jgi:hypothetical protein
MKMFFKKSLKKQNLANEQKDELQAEFLEVFGAQNNEELFHHLAQIDTTNNVCAKKLGKSIIIKIILAGGGAWTCKDCEKDSTCIMCNDCFEKSKEKHKNHRVFFKSSVSGCCDCGDPDAWYKANNNFRNPDGFCSDHSGIITSDIEIKNQIYKTFTEQEIQSITSLLYKIFTKLNIMIHSYAQKKDSESMLYICDTLIYLKDLGSKNFPLLTIIVDFMSQNFPVDTDHCCYIFNPQELDMKIELSVDKHVCKCSLFHNLIRIWDRRFDQKVKIDSLLYTFLKSYKFKFLFGFSYMASFDIIMKNESEYLRTFYIQCAIEELCCKIVESTRFIEGLFDRLYNLTVSYLDDKDYGTLFNVVYEFYMDILYIMKPKSSQLLSKNYKIIKRLVDILCLIHHGIKFKAATQFEYEGFQDNLITTEYYFLNLFSLIVSNFDFSANDKADEVLFYIIDKLRGKDNYIGLNENEYTFHIVLNRILGIYLNRYAFSLSVALDIDLVMAIKQIINKYYNHITTSEKEISFNRLLLDIITGTIKFLGFINSINAKYWVYYGENMLYYHHLYYTLEIFYLCDFSLIKLVASLDQDNSILSLESYLDLTNINKFYSNFMKDLFSLKLPETNIKESSMFTRNLEILLTLICNDSYMIDLLSYSYERFKSNKNTDPLILKIISKEGHCFIDSVRKRIVHIIISQQNSIYFSEIIKLLPFYIKDVIPSEKIEEILGSMCDKITVKNKPVSFRLKKEFLKYIDLNYIIEPTKKSSAERYLMEFESNEVALNNTPDTVSYSILKNLYSTFKTHFYTNDRNVELTITLLVFLLKQLSFNGLIFGLIKVLDIFVCEISRNGYLQKHENIIKKQEFLDALSKAKYQDQHLQNACNYLYRQISMVFKLIENGGSLGELSKDTYTIVIDENKSKAKENQERLMKMMKEKSSKFKNTLKDTEKPTENYQISINNTLLPLHEDNPEKCYNCVICKADISSKDFFNEPFGRIGIFSNSSFIYHSKIQTLKREFEKMCKKDSMQLDDSQKVFTTEEQLLLKDILVKFKRTKPELKKTFRYVSCNHVVHFKCYSSYISKLIISGTHNTKEIQFVCPLCRTMSNSFIPLIDFQDLIKYDNTSFYLKGVTFAELFLYYKELNEGSEISYNIYENYNIEMFNGNVIHTLSHFIEKLITVQSRTSFLLKDLNDVNNNNERFYEAMKNIFINSLNLTDILRNEAYDNALDILKDYLLCIRILVKTNHFQARFFFNKMLDIHRYWKTEFIGHENIVNNIENDKVSNILFENVFLMLVLLDESEFNYFNIVFKHFVSLILIQFFIIQFHSNFSIKVEKEIFEKKFLIDNFFFMINSPQYAQPIKKHMNYYLRKLTLLKNLFKDNKRIKDNFNDIDSEFSYYCDLLNFGPDYKVTDFIQYDENFYPSFWIIKEDNKSLLITLFNEYYKNKLKLLSSTDEGNIDLINTDFVIINNEHVVISPSLLLLTNDLYNGFISLPHTLLDLSQTYHRLECPNCKTCPIYAILCLSCGEKICYMDICCKNLGKKKNMYEYIYHNKICGGGEGVYLHIYNGEISYSLLNYFVPTKLNLYQNRFGESIRGRSINYDYVLNVETLKNVLNEYRNLSFSKYFKINQNVNLRIADDDEDS